MPSEWLGVHGGRSYGPVPRGPSLPSLAVYCTLYCTLLYIILYCTLYTAFIVFGTFTASLPSLSLPQSKDDKNLLSDSTTDVK
jgi:hypothetical protein